MLPNALEKIYAIGDKYGFKIPEKAETDSKKLKELETAINHALGVLVEDGPFAFAIFFLWSFSILKSITSAAAPFCRPTDSVFNRS